MKRQRGRSRRSNNSNNANRSMESSGPDVKVRGTAKQIFDKYETLARDAASSGHRVKAENYRQHAEHYLRIVNAIEAAKEKAREEAEAQAQSESAVKTDDEKTSESKSRRKYPPQIRKSDKSSGEGTNEKAAPENVEGLEIVQPETDSVDSEGKKESSSSRRRKAPSREDTDKASGEEKTATEAAE